jgi:hypothetical protein
MSDDALSMVLGALVRLEGNLTKVQDDLTALRVDTMARLGRHENHLASIRDDIRVAMGQTDHMRRIHGHDPRGRARPFGPRGRGRQGMSRV